MSRPVCQATRKDGLSCRAAALASGWCWSHDPARQDIAAEARRAGAAKGGQIKALRGRYQRLDSAAGLIRFLSTLMQDALAGRLEVDLLRGIAYTASVQRSLIEAGDLAERLTRLEAQIKMNGRIRRWS